MICMHSDENFKSYIIEIVREYLNDLLLNCETISKQKFLWLSIYLSTPALSFPDNDSIKLNIHGQHRLHL